MSAAYQAFETRYQYTSGDIVSDNAIGVNAGDLIIVDLHTNDSTILPSGVTDSLGNSYTALTQQTNSNANERTYYCTSAGTGASVTFTGSFSVGSASKTINITTYRPSAAVTWSLEANTTGSSYGTAVSATAGSVAGSDMVAHCIVYTNASRTFSSQTIGGVSPDGTLASDGNADIFYKLYTSDTGSVAPADTLSSATQWVCRFLIFKATASGGGSTLTMADMAQAMAIDAPALTQKHSLNIADMSHAMSIDAIALAQKHLLGIADMLHTMTFGSPSLANSVTLAVADMAQTMTVDGVALVQAHIIAPNDMAQAMSIDTIALSQRHLLTLSDMAHTMSMDSVNFAAHNGAIIVAFSGSSATITFAGSAADADFAGTNPTITFGGS